MAKTARVAPVKSRPFKKRVRPDFEESVQYASRQVVSPIQDKRKIVIRPPPYLQGDIHMSSNMMGRQLADSMGFSSQDDRVPGSNEDGSIHSSMATNVAAGNDYANPNLVVISPPKFERQTTTFFVDTEAHKAFLMQSQADRIAAVHQNLLEITASAKQDSHLQVLFQPPKIVKTTNTSEKCDTMYVEEGSDEGEDIWGDATRGGEFTDSVDTPKRPSGHPPATSMSSQKAMSESQWIRSQMKAYLEADPSRQDPEYCSDFDPTHHQEQLQLSDLALTPPRANSSKPNEHVYTDCDDMTMKGAVATMQQPIIETPKRLFGRKKSSFSSFASSASGSSLSSCVTPSPAKRMMGPSFSKSFGTKPPGHRFSHSMGSLNGFSESALKPVALTYMESAPAKLNLDIRDRAKGIEAIRKSDNLSEEQKVQQASMELVDPSNYLANQRPNRQSQSQRLASGQKPQRELLESKRSLGNASLAARRRTFSTAKANALLAKTSNSMAPSQRFATLHMRHLQQKRASNDELAFPNLPMHRDSKTGSSLNPRS
ncbi:MAG: hypothetical protein SGILL_003736, partial [Bacillariaceae sp.]